jgi:hypothetical protein
LKPSAFDFDGWMKAYGQTEGTRADKQALSMAFDAMKALETSDFGLPDPVSFLMPMRAVNHLVAKKAERVRLL